MLTVKSPWEVSQQRGMVVRADTEEYLERIGIARAGSEAFPANREALRRRKGRQRYPGVSPLGKGGIYQGGDLGILGVSYSAVSHIVRRVESQLREDKKCQENRI
jgi:hypothetical protein